MHNANSLRQPVVKIAGSPLTGDKCFRQGVAGKTVGTMESVTGGLAHCPQAGNRGAGIYIGSDAAHVIVHRWSHRYELLIRINPCSATRSCDSWKQH